jgi:hypothetical protein
MDPDPDADPAIFVFDLPTMPKKNRFKKKSFCLLIFEGICSSFSKIKSQKEVTKQQESSFFLLFLLGDRRIQEAQKHVDPVDPDPQHCFFLRAKSIL